MIDSVKIACRWDRSWQLSDGGCRHHPRRSCADRRLLSDEGLAPYERLFFELYGAALGGQAALAPVLDGVVTSWLAGGDAYFPAVPAAGRQARARMALAFVDLNWP